MVSLVISAQARASGISEMSESIVIVFEKQPRWVPELQRQFLDENVRVLASRSIVDVEKMLCLPEKFVLLLDLEAAPEDVLQFLGQRVGDDSHAVILVIGSKRTAELEWKVRELGVIEFVMDETSGENLAGLCRRQWVRFSRTSY